MSDTHPHDEAPTTREADRDLGSGSRRIPANTLDRLVREARTATPLDIDWEKVDVGLFDRVTRDVGYARALGTHRGRRGAWVGLAGIAALFVAAIAIQPASRAHEPAWVSKGGSGSSPDSAGDLTVLQGSGEVLVGAVDAHRGAHARTGETIRTHEARALFESASRVSWLLEDESQVEVERTASRGSPLILALAHGTVEAQVTPIASGEAFAIDVDGVRVAVHGTHLRVARDGDDVVVDLSEGTISIGAPPRIGSTYGMVVTAPAHVEFRASSLATSIRVDHDRVSMGKIAEVDFADEGPATGAASSSAPPGTPARDASISTSSSSPRGWIAKPTSRASMNFAAAPSPVADSLVANAVRACATGRPHSTDLTITVSSTLTVEVQDDGLARLAHFDPPLAPDIQACASHTIYSTRFVGHGPHKISIELER